MVVLVTTNQYFFTTISNLGIIVRFSPLLREPEITIGLEISL